MAHDVVLVSGMRLVRVAALPLAVALGCQSSSEPPGPKGSSSAAPSSTSVTHSPSAEPRPSPTSVPQVEAFKKKGVVWTNEEIRIHYNRVVWRIEPLNQHWRREDVSPEERARRATELRQKARLVGRAMMANALEVEVLRKRDQDRYNNPDGPTFEQLVEIAKKNGVTGAAVYEGIIADAQRPDAATNAPFGVESAL